MRALALSPASFLREVADDGGKWRNVAEGLVSKRSITKTRQQNYFKMRTMSNSYHGVDDHAFYYYIRVYDVLLLRCHGRGLAA